VRLEDACEAAVLSRRRGCRLRGERIGRATLAVAVAPTAVVGLNAAGLAGAAELNFTVNSTSDAVDARVGDGECATSAGTCTLRAAIQETNALPGADRIQVPAGTYEIAITPLNQNDIRTASKPLAMTGWLRVRKALNSARSPSSDARSCTRSGRRIFTTTFASKASSCAR
jgi:hypothetical protein